MAKRIDVSDLNIFYGNFLAVQDVTVSIEPRSITALIGPSGCGKSTFLRALNLMHDLTPAARVTGEVLFDGENIYDAKVDPVDLRRRKVGFRGARLDHGEARHRVLRVSRRAATDRARMATVIRRAPAQASRCQLG